MVKSTPHFQGSSPEEFKYLPPHSFNSLRKSVWSAVWNSPFHHPPKHRTMAAAVSSTPIVPPAPVLPPPLPGPYAPEPDRTAPSERSTWSSVPSHVSAAREKTTRRGTSRTHRYRRSRSTPRTASTPRCTCAMFSRGSGPNRGGSPCCSSATRTGPRPKLAGDPVSSIPGVPSLEHGNSSSELDQDDSVSRTPTGPLLLLHNRLQHQAGHGIARLQIGGARVCRPT
jgi:hypothetical protein